jgi:hypothetical protein
MTPTPNPFSEPHLPADLPPDSLPEAGMRGDGAYELLHSHLLLDGNARLNLATFVGTWIEPEARQLLQGGLPIARCVGTNSASISMWSPASCPWPRDGSI